MLGMFQGLSIKICSVPPMKIPPCGATSPTEIADNDITIHSFKVVFGS